MDRVTLTLATLLVVLSPEASLQELKSSHFTIISGARHQSNEAWTELQKDDADCAILAISLEAEGFNVKKEGGDEELGRCQFIRKVNEDDVAMADGYVLYSTIALTSE